MSKAMSVCLWREKGYVCLNPTTNAVRGVNEQRMPCQSTGVQTLLFTITCLGEILQCLFLFLPDELVSE